MKRSNSTRSTLDQNLERPDQVKTDLPFIYPPKSVNKRAMMLQFWANEKLSIMMEISGDIASGVDSINFLRPIRAPRPTFENLFRGVGRALHGPSNFDRAISMLCALRPTFMKTTPCVLNRFCNIDQDILGVDIFFKYFCDETRNYRFCKGAIHK